MKTAEKEFVVRALRGAQFNRERHGGLYDRGSADSYYGRPRNPHWFPMGTYNGVELTELTELEVAEYNAGYDANEASGSKKDWN